jgi:hypothetical protein
MKLRRYFVYIIGMCVLASVLTLTGLGAYGAIESAFGLPVPAGVAAALGAAIFLVAVSAWLGWLMLVAPHAKRFRLTLEGDTSSRGDVVVGTFDDERWALSAGEHFLQLDRHGASEYAGFRVEPAV